MKKEFIKFLKENNALIPFICNLALGPNLSLSQYLNKRKNDPRLWMDHGFLWLYTSEGIGYWRALKAKWFHQCTH